MKSDTPRTIQDLLREGGNCDSCECHDWGKVGSDYGGTMLEAADRIDELERELAEKTRLLKSERQDLANQINEIRKEARDKALEEVKKIIPTNWLDPLLSGETRVIRTLAQKEVEELLLELLARIHALKGKK